MAAANGREGAGLSELLFREAYQFNFYQAVRLLERLLRERARDDPHWQRYPVGGDRRPAEEVVRFRALPSLNFPPGDITQLRKPPALDGLAEWELPPPEMVVAFLGLIGPAGALPHHYTTLVLRRGRVRDYALRDFLDIFNHRFVSLLYRVWEKYRLPFAYERASLEGTTDLTTQGLYCLTGMGTAGLRGRLPVDDEVFLYYAGHFAHYPRSALALENILEDYFQIPVEVQQCQGQWLSLDPDDRSLLPGPGLGLGLNNQMGLSVVVGDRVWDVQSKIRLRVGPLTYEQFRRLMPNGDVLSPLLELARAFVGPEFDLDVQPVLLAPEVPRCRMGAPAKQRAFLGWNTWSRSRPARRKADEAIFSARPTPSP
jgi:type VI secretion system protein ImpH